VSSSSFLPAAVTHTWLPVRWPYSKRRPAAPLIGGLSTAATFESFVVVIRSKASRFRGNTIGHTENAMRVSGPTTTESGSESRRAITSISGSSPEPLRRPSGLAEPQITAGGYAQRSTERILGRSTRQSVLRLAEEIGFA